MGLYGEPVVPNIVMTRSLCQEGSLCQLTEVPNPGLWLLQSPDARIGGVAAPPSQPGTLLSVANLKVRCLLSPALWFLT